MPSFFLYDKNTFPKLIGGVGKTNGFILKNYNYNLAPFGGSSKIFVGLRHTITQF